MTDLPDLFRFNDGSHLSSPAGWPRRQQELLDATIPLEYGPIPPSVPIQSELLSSHPLPDPAGSRHVQYRLHAATTLPLSFLVDLYLPASEYPLSVIVDGDMCWPHLDRSISSLVMENQVILALFNRTEIVPDHDQYGRTTGLYAAFPGLVFGAMSAWAWGYHRTVDFLLSLPEVDAAKIAISGHSRGGKAVLLAGVTDARIALTNPNNSGCGGAGCYRLQGPNSETLADIMRRYGYWFNPSLAEYIGRESELPFDQHFLKAAVAPRLLLTTEALDDHWSNPSGTWHTHLAALEVYRFLGLAEKIGIWYRSGGHAHGLADFQVLLDFIHWQFSGRQPQTQFNSSPF
jgi:hypothetical protein